MRAEDRQIAEMLKQGITPAEIAGALELELSVVQHRILTVPALGTLATVTGEDIAKGGLESLTAQAVKTMQEIMLFGENEGCKLKAAQFVLSRFSPEAPRVGVQQQKPVKTLPKPNGEVKARLEEIRARLLPKAVKEEEVTTATLLPYEDLVAANG